MLYGLEKRIRIINNKLQPVLEANPVYCEDMIRRQYGLDRTTYLGGQDCEDVYDELNATGISETSSSTLMMMRKKRIG